MKSKWWIVLIVVIAVGGVLFIRNNGTASLISPSLIKTTSTQVQEVPNATPNAPKTYNFDSSTDLKTELESVNPQILDSDFE